MRKSIQREVNQLDKTLFDQIGEEVIHRSMAISMVQNMPLEMLQRLLPLKIGGDEKIIKLEIRIEA